MFLFIFLLVMCLPLHGVTADIVSVMEGDSVTLNTGVQTNQQDKIRWYYNDILIARISGDLSNICTDVQCNKGNGRFRDRLKLDHQTGSLTITHTRNTDSEHYKLRISSDSSDSEKIFSVSVHNLSGVDTEVSVSVMEGYSVTLNTGVQTNQQDRIRWYYNDIRIAEISGDLSNICTDVQCNEDTERFRDRMKLDHQTGSLTITHTRNTHSGEYKLLIISSDSSYSKKIFSLYVHGVTADIVSVMEGESVTLNTGVQTNQQYRIRWYYNDILIARINGDLSNICTDVQCNKVTERFRDRLKLDRQTGSLTITHTRDTDSGEYTLEIISRGSYSEKIFSISVYGVTGVDTEEVSVKEGDSVTLNTGVQINQQYRITWYYNDILIARITGDLSYICTDVQCNEDTERFRDRLKLDHQTGSLTITHTTDTDSGEYTLWIISRRSNSEKIFSVSVHAFSAPAPGPDPSQVQPGIYDIVAVAVLPFVAVICCCTCRARRNACRTNCNTQASGAEDSSPDQRDTLM
ncbi:hypothetical protein R3I93_016865 [Phoxinus phoxinus]|uniref:Immunoglobulin domain-containing protein n=1 Tax=Phoxinus phoxinus TaxID=58324 RepID=A0AAN9GY99_9TELE